MSSLSPEEDPNDVVAKFAVHIGIIHGLLVEGTNFAILRTLATNMLGITRKVALAEMDDDQIVQITPVMPTEVIDRVVGEAVIPDSLEGLEGGPS